MSENDSTVTGQQNQANGSDEPKTSEEKSYVKYRIEKALKKKEPEIFAKARKQIAEELGLDDDDFESLKEVVTKSKSTFSEAEKLSSEMQKLKKLFEKERAEKEELHKALSSYKADLNNKLVGEAIVSAVDGIGVRNVAQVTKLLRDNLVVEDGKVMVVDEKGEVSDKSVKDFVAEFLKENQHFVAASNSGGAGSRPGNGEVKGEDARKALLTVEGRRAAFDKLFAQKDN